MKIKQIGKIHKAKTNWTGAYHNTKCGLSLWRKYARYKWEEVHCKNCLRSKK